MPLQFDIAILVMAADNEWARFLLEQLAKFPRVTCTSIVLDDVKCDDDTYDRVRACRQSVVGLLIVTFNLLDFMADRANRLAATLREAEATSKIVPMLLVNKQDMDEVTEKHGYSTCDWVYKDALCDTPLVQQKIAEVLDIVDERRKMNKRAAVEFFPSTVHERETRVAMLFKDEVQGQVILKLRPTNIQIAPKMETQRLFTFDAPQVEPGKYKVLVYIDNKRLQSCQPELTFCGVEMLSFTSPHYLAQALRLNDQKQLDLHLKEVFNNSLPSDTTSLDAIFKALPEPDTHAGLKKMDTLYPTLLHYAAAYGMSEFCAALLECPGSRRAYHIRNCKGQDPADLAGQNGFDELENYIIDFVEMDTVNDECSGYMTISQTCSDEVFSGTESPYMIMTAPCVRHTSVIDLTQFTTGFPPQLPSRPEPETASVDDLSSLAISRAGRPDRPPLPPPRSKSSIRIQSEQHFSSPVTGSENKRKAFTLPSDKRLVGRKSAPCMLNLPSPTEKPTASIQTPAPALPVKSDTSAPLKNYETNSKKVLMAQAWKNRRSTLKGTFKEKQAELRQIKKEFVQDSTMPNKDKISTRELKIPSDHSVTLRDPEPNIREAIDLDESNPGCLFRDSGLSEMSQSSILSENDTSDTTSQEDVTRRDSQSSRASRENRLTLGQLYQQLLSAEQKRSGHSTPPVPPRRYGSDEI